MFDWVLNTPLTISKTCQFSSDIWVFLQLLVKLVQKLLDLILLLKIIIFKNYYFNLGWFKVYAKNQQNIIIRNGKTFL